MTYLIRIAFALVIALPLTIVAAILCDANVAAAAAVDVACAVSAFLAYRSDFIKRFAAKAVK